MFFRQISSGSILSAAARSSMADMVRKQACGWFGARQARAGPLFVATPVWFIRWLGLCQTYGSGAMPAPPGPPVPQELDSQPVLVPPFFAPIFISPDAGGRPPGPITPA